MNSFTEMPLSATMQQRLANAKFHTPTPIQSAAIPHALAGKDLVATAQTGTGKTLAFAVPIIEALATRKSRRVEALVLVPTRELAIQVHEHFQLLSGNAIPVALVTGGLSEHSQLKALRSGARVVVATPGRLEDYLGRKLVDLQSLRILALDEADRMLDMGFLPAIRRIISALPHDRQTMCFSATLEASVAALVNNYMREPVRVAIGSTLKPADTVELHAFEVPATAKFEVVRSLLRAEKGRTLVFVRTKRGTERLTKHLNHDGVHAAMIHGDRSQSQRNAALNGFKEGRCKVLVATDVASRGLHIEDVAHVINYDLPDVAEDFIHRIGRTGRAGTRGRASSIVSPVETLELRSIERSLRLNIRRAVITPDLAADRKPRRDSLPNRSLQPMPGEVFA